jgi:hypothetical protein
MEDRIRQFIRDHRNAFDEATPDAHGWKGLEHALDRLQTADGLERSLLVNRILLDTETPADHLWAGIDQALSGRPSAGHDSIESFIAANRDHLDDAVPDLRVWSGIDQTLPASPRQAIKVQIGFGWQRSILRAAASIALLLTGVGLGLWYARHDDKAMAGMAMSDVSHEYAELEQYYQRDIAGKQVKLTSLNGSQSAEIHEDLEQLDDVMTELRQELATVPPGNREQVVRAMIDNYKAKTAILQRVLERLEQTETNNSGKKHETKRI